jgi:hypothetical protein
MSWEVYVGVAVAFLLGALIGGLLVRRFGVDWLAMLVYVVGPEGAKIAAGILWDSFLCNQRLFVLRFKDREGFVTWIEGLVVGLAPKVEVISVQQEAITPLVETQPQASNLTREATSGQQSDVPPVVRYRSLKRSV